MLIWAGYGIIKSTEIRHRLPAARALSLLFWQARTV